MHILFPAVDIFEFEVGIVPVFQFLRQIFLILHLVFVKVPQLDLIEIVTVLQLADTHVWRYRKFGVVQVKTV